MTEANPRTQQASLAAHPATSTTPRKSARRSRRAAAQSDESRQRILDATIEIASERGYEGTSISLVSERSGLPVGSIYWHFTNKDGLLAAVIERSYHQWRQSAQSALQPPGWDQAGAGVLADVLVQTLVGAPEFLRLGLMLALERRPVEATARESFLRFREESLERLVDNFTAVIAQSREEGAAELGRRLAELTVAMTDGLFIAYQVRPDTMDVGALIDLYVTAIGSLIAAHAAD